MATSFETLSDYLIYGDGSSSPHRLDLGHSLQKRTMMFRVKPSLAGASAQVIFSQSSTASAIRCFGFYLTNSGSPTAKFNINMGYSNGNVTSISTKTLGSGAEWNEWMSSWHTVVLRFDFIQNSSTDATADWAQINCFVDGELFSVPAGGIGPRQGNALDREFSYMIYYGGAPTNNGVSISDFNMWEGALADEDCLALSASRLDPLEIRNARQLRFPLRNGNFLETVQGLNPDTIAGSPDVLDPFYFSDEKLSASLAPVILGESVTPVVPDAPTNPAAVAGDEQVTVSWTNAPTATSHKVYRDTSSPVTTGSTDLGTQTTPYVDTGRTNGVEYFYAIAGVNAEGEGPLSSEVSATPAAAFAYTPTPELSEPQVIGSWRIDQMSLDKQNAGLTLREDRGIQDVKVPGAFFNNTVFPNIDADIIGDPIPNAIGVGLRGLPAFLIDQDTNTFKVLNNPLVSWDGFRTSDNEKFIPDTLDLATAEFTYAAWDGTTDLFADVSCLGENPVDAVEILLTDDLRGANLDSSRLDTTSTGKGFGSTGARLDYIRGHDSRTGAEKVTFSISLYMAEPKKVEAWIQEVAAASVMVNPYVDQAGVWQCKAWRPIVSDDMLEIDELFLKDPKFTWKMSEPVTKAVANYAKDYGRDSVQSYEYESDELLKLRGLTKHAPQTRELPLSDLFSARYWAQTVVAQRGVPRRIITCRVPQEFSLLELGDYTRVIYAPLQIDGPFEVIKSSQQADSMEVDLQLIDVRGFKDTVGFYMDDVAPDWDNSRTDAEIKNDRENGAWYTDDGGYADTDDPKRSYEEAVYI